MTEDSPSKKTKLINDGMKAHNSLTDIVLFLNPPLYFLLIFCFALGFCIFVGNLENHKKAEEISDALAQHFMTKSLLVQNIRMDRSR